MTNNKQTKKRPPTSGSFRPGCKPGPGRIPRLPKNEDQYFLPIDVPYYSDPPEPIDKSFENMLRYRNRVAERIAFGYWTGVIYVPKSDVRRFIELYKNGRLRDPSYTKLEAYHALIYEQREKQSKIG